MVKNYIKKYRIRNVVIVFSFILTSLLNTGASIVLTFSLNALIDFNLEGFFIWNMLSFIMWIVFFIIHYFQSAFLESTTQLVVSDIRQDLTNRISNVSYYKFMSKNEGTYVSWLNADMKDIEEKGISQYYALLNNIILCIISVIALLKYHYSLVLASFLLMGIMLIVPKLFSKKMSDSTSNLSIQNEVFSSGLQDTISGYNEYYNYNVFDQMKLKILNLSKHLAQQKIAYTKTTAISQGFIGSVNILSQVLIGIHTGALAYFNIISIGSINTTGNIAANIFNSVSQMSSNLFIMKSTDIYFEKYIEFESDNTFSKEEIESKYTFDASLKLKNISYEIADKKIFQKFNFTISKGKKYALIGDSGSGKSTLLNILSGKINHFEGDIVYDDIPVTKEDLKNIREKIIYVYQNPYLFNDSVANNISLNKPHNGIQVDKIIEDLGIDSYAQADSIIEEHGKNLSGGERQRIAFARALYHSNEDKIILLDESTANLDKETALKLENFILDNPNLTAIMVTHHLYDENKDKFDEIIHLPSLSNS